MKGFDARILKDRRARPTPPLSRFTFSGRRRSFRRETDKQGGGYVDRYGLGLFSSLVLILALNVLDVLFTMTVLNAGGCEVNPVVGTVIELWGDRFWIWKITLSSVCVILLCLHRRFRLVGMAILGITAIYAVLAVYQFSLIIGL